MKLGLGFRLPSGRRARLGALSGSGLLLVLAVLAAANLLAQKIFFRWDWTADRRYSLSRASAGLLRALEDPLLIRAYISAGLPQPYETQGRYVRDLLQEYRAAGRGRVRVEFLDPESSEKDKADAGRAGLAPARFTEVAGDQFQSREGYMGVALFYQDKQESIPFVKSVEGLEYELSSRVKQMMAGKKKVLGFVTGHGEIPPDAWQEGPAARLFDEFDVQPVRLSTAAAPPDALFLIGPQSPLAPGELAVLDGWLARGTPAAVFLNRRLVDVRDFRSFVQRTGLDPLIEHYGLRIEPDFVLDAQCQRIQVQSRQGGYAVANILNYPAIPLSNRLARGHALTRRADVLGFPFVHALEWVGSVDRQGPRSSAGGPVPPAAAQGELKMTPLAQSSAYSWISPGRSWLDPYQLRGPEPSDPKGPFILAALVEGSTVTYTEPRRPVPALRLFVAGTGFFADPGMPNPEGNALFLVGLAQWLSQDPHLLAIPSKGSPYRPLRPLPAAARPLVKLAAFFFLPLAIVLGGAVRWRRRAAAKRALAREFEKPVPPPEENLTPPFQGGDIGTA